MRAEGAVGNLVKALSTLDKTLIDASEIGIIVFLCVLLSSCCCCCSDSTQGLPASCLFTGCR